MKLPRFIKRLWAFYHYAERLGYLRGYRYALRELDKNSNAAERLCVECDRNPQSQFDRGMCQALRETGL